MSVVAGTPSIDVPNACEIRTRSPWVTFTMTARRLSVAIAFRTTSPMADADDPGGVTADGAGAADATDGATSARVANPDPARSARRPQPSPYVSRGMITTLPSGSMPIGVPDHSGPGGA